eukprot:Seg382.10 transcript_id=Seg382.10/GoldUCD/mRNA.D3Y31 product="Pyroglutamylated RFamide peptide receptor" protein_id=Seg382.10/GoldUCD/D3Y31
MSNVTLASNLTAVTLAAATTVTTTTTTTLIPNDTTVTIPPLFSNGFEIGLRIIYLLMTFLGIGGNGLIIYLIVSKKVGRTSFNILLTNLSLADLLANFFLYPYIFIDIQGLDISQSTGRVLCNFTIGLTSFFICCVVSFLTLTTISVNRYICINHPLKFSWQQSKDGSKIFSVITWVISILVLSPNFFSFVYLKQWGICRREWPNGLNGKLYTLFTALFGLLAPVLVLFYTYIATVKTLRNKVSDTVVVQSIPQNTRRKTVRLLGWLIVVFALCWSPFFIYWVLSRYANVFSEGNMGDIQRMRAIRLTIIPATLHTIADPILYGLVSEQYRVAVKKFFNMHTPMDRSASLTTSISRSITVRVRSNTYNEKSSFSMKAIDEEHRSKMTPESAIVMSHIRSRSKSIPADAKKERHIKSL